MNKKNLFILILCIIFLMNCGKFNSKTEISNNVEKNFSQEEIKNIQKNAINTQNAFIQVHKMTKNSVVNIRTKKTIVTTYYNPLEELLFGTNGQRKEIKEAGSLGSGFIISKNGHIITNNHVIDGADEIFIKFSNGKEYKASIVGTSPEVDIAILKINSKESFIPLEFGNSDEIEIGQWAIAFGNPLGLNDSMTVGIVSATGRSSLGIEEIENFIQTDAAINSGNSGGPLIDINGKVIGVNTAIYSTTGGNIGLGFAIPSNLVNTVKDSIISTGSFQKTYIGVRLSNIDAQTAKQLNLESTNGVLITKVIPDGPAHKAGIKSMDVITAIDGKEITSGGSLIGELVAKKTGQNVIFDIIRNGKKISVKVTLEKL